MSHGIFATYRSGENRVTASILAVCQALALHRTERLLGALLEDADFRLVTFRNQITDKARASVPDAEIAAACRLLIETKIARRALDARQLREHLAHLKPSAAGQQILLVLTPDETCPEVIATLADDRLAWASFATLDQAIDDLLGDKTEVTSEREAFLLRELQRMLLDENLLALPTDTVIVPARNAWREYLQTGGYVCQPDRTFQHAAYLGFYENGAIHPVVPKILQVEDRVAFASGKRTDAIGQVIDRSIAAGFRSRGDQQKVFALSDPTDPATIHLAAPLPNDLLAESGRPTAFTQNQRYVRSDRLRTATRTSDVVSLKK